MEASTPVIASEFGQLKFGLRAYEWRYGSKEFDGTVWLCFDPEHDLEASGPVLSRSRQMAFEVQAEIKLPGRIIAYLGRRYDKWDEELAIELSYRGADAGVHKWWAEGGDNEDPAVEQIRKNYWCAGEARMSLYLADDSRKRPVHDTDGEVLSTRVRLGYDDPAYEALYSHILDDFSNLRGDLASRFEQFAEFKKARQRAEQSVALELYKRLCDILPQYKKALGEVVRDPTVQLVPSQVRYTFGAGAADRHFSRRRPASRLRRVRQAEPIGAHRLPTHFSTVEAKETPDTVANRYVGASVLRVLRLIKRVRRHLEQEQNMVGRLLKRHEQAFKHLGREEQRFTRYRHRLPVFIESADAIEDPTLSAEFAYDRRYGRLRHLTQRLDYLLSYVDASDLPYEVEAFNVLYERWCFVRVIEALQALGFTFEGDEGRRKTMFYQNPIPNEVNCKMVHPQCKNKVLEVWYEREYPVLREPTDYYDPDRPYGLEKRGYDRSSYEGWKNRPDIAIEFHDLDARGKMKKGSPPSIITLDPTLGSPQNRREKYKYQEGIRSFVDEGADGESRKIVCAAWGMWPGKKNEDCFVTIPSNKPGYRQHGFIHVQPGNGSVEKLPETLKEILVASELW